MCFPRESIASCLGIAGVDRRDIGLVAASTDDVAKTISRWAPATKERYYHVRRRKAAPGPFAELTRRDLASALQRLSEKVAKLDRKS